jgi:hypothetical protein
MGPLERTESFNPAKIGRDAGKIERAKNDHSHLLKATSRPMASCSREVVQGWDLV